MSERKGIHASLLTTVEGIKSGLYRVLFGAPESIVESDRWRELLMKQP